MLFHIQFSHPYFLLYLFSIPLLVITHFLLLERAKQKGLKFANFEAIKKITGEKLITKNLIILFIRLSILVILILAASGPVLWYKTKLIETNLVFLIDASASMSTRDYNPTRLEFGKNIAKAIVNNLNVYSNIGVVSFASISYIKTPLSDSKERVIEAIDSIDVIEAGGTDIPGAIITATNMLMGKEGKSIILMSDGSNTLSYLLQDPIQKAIDYAKKNNVIIHTIGIGREGAPVGYLPTYYNVPSTYEEDVLKRISNETGGIYIKAEKNSSISEIVNTLLAEEQEGFVKKDLTHGLLVIGLILVFIEWGLINTRFKRIP